jgi:hypothetical protein
MVNQDDGISGDIRERHSLYFSSQQGDPLCKQVLLHFSHSIRKNSHNNDPGDSFQSWSSKLKDHYCNSKLNITDQSSHTWSTCLIGIVKPKREDRMTFQQNDKWMENFTRWKLDGDSLSLYKEFHKTMYLLFIYGMKRGQHNHHASMTNCSK